MSARTRVSARANCGRVSTDDQQYADTVRDTMSELPAEFSRPSDIAATLHRVTSTAVEMIDGVDYADVLLISGPDTFGSVAATDQIATDLDAVQQRFRKGRVWMRRR